MPTNYTAVPQATGVMPSEVPATATTTRCHGNNILSTKVSVRLYRELVGDRIDTIMYSFGQRGCYAECEFFQAVACILWSTMNN